MSRKTILWLALVLVVLAALVWAGWPVKEEGAVSVICAGLSRNAPYPVVIILTNRSMTVLTCTALPEFQTNGVWFNHLPHELLYHGNLLNQTARSIGYLPAATNRWRILAYYWDPASVPFAAATRSKLATMAGNHGWPLLHKFFFPNPKFKTAYGPEMLGDQPAPPERK